jgi:hypothetical protein
MRITVVRTQNAQLLTPWSTKLIHIIYKHSVPTSKKRVSITAISWLMLCREITAVYMTSEIFIAVKMTIILMTMFYVLPLRRLVGRYKRFRETYCFHLQSWLCKMSVSFYQTTQRNVLEHSPHHSRHHENLKSHLAKEHFPKFLLTANSVSGFDKNYKKLNCP